jgi:hypothetical protein
LFCFASGLPARATAEPAPAPAPAPTLRAPDEGLGDDALAERIREADDAHEARIVARPKVEARLERRRPNDLVDVKGAARAQPHRDQQARAARLQHGQAEKAARAGEQAALRARRLRRSSALDAARARRRHRRDARGGDGGRERREPQRLGVRAGEGGGEDGAEHKRGTQRHPQLPHRARHLRLAQARVCRVVGEERLED